jgi:cytosine permease
MAAGKTTDEVVLGNEYEHESVALSARRSIFSVAMVWLRFPMIITGAMPASTRVAGLGFKSALLARLIGKALMFAYVGGLGALGTQRGVSFALGASAVFGRKGCVLASGQLSTLLLGWSPSRPTSPAR